MTFVVLLFGDNEPRINRFIEQLPQLHPGTAMLGEKPDGVPHLVSQVPAEFDMFSRNCFRSNQGTSSYYGSRGT